PIYRERARRVRAECEPERRYDKGLPVFGGEPAGVAQHVHEHRLLGVEGVAEPPVGHAAERKDDDGPGAVGERAEAAVGQPWPEGRVVGDAERRRGLRAGGLVHWGHLIATTSISPQHPSRARPLTSIRVLAGRVSAKWRFLTGEYFSKSGMWVRNVCTFTTSPKPMPAAS